MNTTTKHMENKQTAVEWLFHKLWNEPKDKFVWYALLKQAKGMNQEQIEEAYGYEAYDEEGNALSAEQYYNETYVK